ncbi:MAG: hypothetical protein CVU97_03175 [Firmicutes bacterium HGW-Firmicutes-21]|nr:MAG: hypothetical protein CVU97_03175 [Firmicutes bacterium HGW-Firmicutes-21]
MKLVDIGYGNLVSAGRVVAVASPESLPVRRLVQDAKNIGRVIDVSCGKKTKAVIITDSEHIILSAETPQALEERFKQE